MLVNLLATGTIYNIPINNTSWTDIIPLLKLPSGENIALMIKSRSQSNYLRSNNGGGTYMTEVSVVYYPQIANPGRGLWIKANSITPSDFVEVEILRVLTSNTVDAVS